MVLGRIRGKIGEIRTERRAKKKIRNWEKARELEEEISKVRQKYPNLSYEEAKVIARKNLRKGRGAKVKSAAKTALRLTKKGLRFSARYYRRPYGRAYRMGRMRR